MKNESKTFVLAESAIMLALSATLYTVSEFIPWPTWIQGGGVTLFASVPLIVLSYRRGFKAALPASFLLGLFELFMGLKNFAWVKGPVSYAVVALFDYILAFGVFGIGGLFRNRKGSTVAKLTAGAVVTNALRFVCHFISGITVWSEYTQGNGGFTNLDSLVHGITKGSVIYSVTYNGGYMLPETVIAVIGCAAIALILPKKAVARYSQGVTSSAEKSQETEQSENETAE